MKTHQQKAAQFLIGAFALVVLTISSITSFGFFYTFFGHIVPAELVGTEVAGLISGSMGVLLLDLACAIWLYTFLHHAETPEQRAIALIMCIATFAGAAASSGAYLALTATADLAIDTATKATVGNIALLVVILATIANFGSAQAYQRYSYANKQKVRESERLDRVQAAEDSAADHLDSLVEKGVKERLLHKAQEIADQQADRLAEIFYRHESAKYPNGVGPVKVESTAPLGPIMSRMADGGEWSETPFVETAERRRQVAVQQRVYAETNERLAAEMDDTEVAPPPQRPTPPRP